MAAEFCGLDSKTNGFLVAAAFAAQTIIISG